MTVFEVVALIASLCGFAMVLGGIWLVGKGVITLASTPKYDALTIEWKKQFRIHTQAPGLAFFLVGLIFVAVALQYLRPSGVVPIEIEGTLKGVEEPVTASVRPINWDLHSTVNQISGRIYPDFSTIILVVNAPGYEPYSKVIKMNVSGRRLAQLGIVELRRKVRESDLSKKIANLPFGIKHDEGAVFGVPK